MHTTDLDAIALAIKPRFANGCNLYEYIEQKEIFCSLRWHGKDQCHVPDLSEMSCQFWQGSASSGVKGGARKSFRIQ